MCSRESLSRHCVLAKQVPERVEDDCIHRIRGVEKSHSHYELDDSNGEERLIGLLKSQEDDNMNFKVDEEKVEEKLEENEGQDIYVPSFVIPAITSPQKITTAQVAVFPSGQFQRGGMNQSSVAQAAVFPSEKFQSEGMKDRRMKTTKGGCRLSPTEEARLMKEETEERRRLRLQQVREQSNQNAVRIRQAVKQEKNRQLQKLASTLQNNLENEKEEKFRHLENQYENSLLGQGHREASEQDYNQILHDLSDLQRADRDRRQKVVANIPKQGFEPPHRRLEDKEERQKNMEEAFEDMYMTDTNYLGDLSLALDPHLPPDTPTATESLEASILTDTTTPLQPPPMSRVPTILKDTSNIQKAQDDISLQKQPENVLKKLMDRIKSQRQEWMSKSMQEVPSGGASMTTKPGQPSLGKSTAATFSEYSISEQGSLGNESTAPVKVVQPEKLPRQQTQQYPQERSRSGQREPVKQVIHPGFGDHNLRSVEEVLKQQKEIEEQKGGLERKKQELNRRQQQLNMSLGGSIYPRHDQEIIAANDQVYQQLQGMKAPAAASGNPQASQGLPLQETKSPASSSGYPQSSQDLQSQYTGLTRPVQNGQSLSGGRQTSQGYNVPPASGNKQMWAEPPQTICSQPAMVRSGALITPSLPIPSTISMTVPTSHNYKQNT